MNVEQLAYLKCPERIRVALVNMGEPAPALDVIKRRLSRLGSRVEGAHIGEPTHSDGMDFRVTGLVVAPKPRLGVSSITPEERARIAKLAQGIPDRPREPKQATSAFRYKGPPPVYGSTTFADKVIDRVCDALELPRQTFFSSSRQKYVVAARSLVVKVLRERNTAVYSYPRIAEIVGRNDHSTMIHSFQQFDNYCRMFPQIAELYAELRGAE